MQGLRAKWTFDETGGLTASDSSGSANDGDLIGFDDDSQWVAGRVGGAIALDGIDDHLVVAHDDTLQLDGEGTTSFWLKPTSYGTEIDAGTFTQMFGHILHKPSQLDIMVVDDPGGVRKTIVANGGSAPQNVLQLDRWQHFTLVFQGGEVTFYKDGFQLQEPIAGALGGFSSEDLVIGSTAPSANERRYYAGALDELAIWDRPLTESEILQAAGLDAEGEPVVVGPPRSATVLEGASITFRVLATGARPVTYQWEHNEAVIEGENSNELTLTGLTAADGGNYRVVVTNAKGTARSDPATLSVQPIQGISSGLLAHYTFDNVEGMILPDDSGNGHAGELRNVSGAPVVPGQIGNAFEFDGIDDFIVVPHDSGLSLTNRGTLAAWVNPERYAVVGGLGRVARKSTNYDFNLVAGSQSFRLYGFKKTAYDAPANSVELSTWQHLAIVVRDGEISFYKNGELLAAPTQGSLDAPNSDPLVIGNFEPGLAINRLFHGLMDDLGIWGRALSDDELTEIYEKGMIGRSLAFEAESLSIRAIELVSGSELVITFFSPYPQRDHVIESSATLLADSWTQQPVSDLADLGEGTFAARFPLGEGPQAFYRVVAVPKPPVFQDDFEGVTDEWTHGGEGDTWERGTPTNGPTGAQSGENVYATALAGNYAAFSDAWLRSPVVDLTGFETATLTFSEWRNVDPSPEFHRTVVNVLDASSLDLLQELSVQAGATDGWEQQSLRLAPGSVDRPVIFEFRLVSDDFNLLEGWYLDDVSVLLE